MKLEIKKLNGVFYLKGIISSETLPDLKNHFNYTLDLGPNVILNMEGIKQIDEFGMEALEELYEEISSMNQRLCISGLKFNQLRNSKGKSLFTA